VVQDGKGIELVMAKLDGFGIVGEEGRASERADVDEDESKTNKR
jgi:hypothetical protein